MGYKTFEVYWRDRSRETHRAYIKARTRDEAYDFTMKKLKNGCYVTAVYNAVANMIKPTDIRLNF